MAIAIVILLALSAAFWAWTIYALRWAAAPLFVLAVCAVFAAGYHRHRL